MIDTTLLLRQVHPSFVQNGRLSSQIFRPTPKDDKMLSVYDSDQINAADAWKHYTDDQGLQSCGVLAVTVAECTTQSLDVVPDPETFQEHALIDYSSFEKNPIEKKAKKLRENAEQRGWLYQDI